MVFKEVRAQYWANGSLLSYHINRIALRVSSQLSISIYDKALRIADNQGVANKDKLDTTSSNVGKIVNLMAVDK